jgi:YidC/Oxa1 family membrane protein insertase
MYAVHGFISKLNDNTLKTIEDGDLDKNENIVGC